MAAKVAQLALDTENPTLSIETLQLINPQVRPIPECNVVLSVDEESKKKALENFRGLIEGINLDEHQKKDDMLVRWLSARNMEPNKALAMLKENLEWRKINDMDNILNWEQPSHLTNGFPFQLCGPDKDGDLFGVIVWRKMDVDNATKAIMDGTVHKEYLRYLWKCLEIVHRIYKETSTPEHTVTQGTLIIDLEGFSMYQFASPKVLAIVIEVVQRYEASYPNMLKSAIVINAPIVFNVLWNAMKPFLSAYTLSRVQIYGYGWTGVDGKSVLRNSFPPNQLPSSVGGCNTTCKNYEESDGYGKLLPVCIPDFPSSNMVCATVPAGQTTVLYFNIETLGTKLCWGFRTDHYDIGFSVVNPDGEEVLTNFRVDSQMSQQKGFIVCEKIGTYSLVFDNTFSKYRSKSLYYTVKLFPS